MNEFIMEGGASKCIYIYHAQSLRVTTGTISGCDSNFFLLAGSKVLKKILKNKNLTART